MQQFVNRLSTPKKISDETNSQRSITPLQNESIHPTNTNLEINNFNKPVKSTNKPMKAFALTDNTTVKQQNETTAPLKKSSSKNAINTNDNSSSATPTNTNTITPTPVRKQVLNSTKQNDLKVIGAINSAKNSAFSHSSSNSNLTSSSINGFQSNNLINSKKSNSNSNSTISTTSSSTLPYKQQKQKPIQTNNKIEKTTTEINKVEIKEPPPPQIISSSNLPTEPIHNDQNDNNINNVDN